MAGIKQMDHCGASWSTAKTWLAASNGFAATKSSGISSMAGVAISERDGAMERDYESTSERRKAKLKTPASIGKEAADRAAATGPWEGAGHAVCRRVCRRGAVPALASG